MIRLHKVWTRALNKPSVLLPVVVKGALFASSFATFAEEKEQEEVDRANRKYAGMIEIRDSGASAACEERGDNVEWGIFACRDFRRGERLVRAMTLETAAEQGTHTIQTGWNTHVFMDLPARFVNHVCNEANVGVRPNKLGAYDFFALREVLAGEELLWDYEATEYEVSNFVCHCGSPNCRGELRGFRHHGDQVITAYGTEYVAPYLLERFKKD